MSYVFTVFIIINTLVLSYGLYIVYTYDKRVSDILYDAIAKELRLQDDRIQKRLQRMEGQAPDDAETPTGHGVIGQPYRRS